MKPTVYILHFIDSDKYYVGSTTNLMRRLKQHRMGNTPSTKRLGDKFTLVFQQETPTLALARNAEQRIKSWKRRDYIEKIIVDQVMTSLNITGH